LRFVAKAYYNENDPYPAQWLRNLIAAGHIADGDVDERSIKDVKSDDLKGYTQCHFFAGIGGWSYALRLAGWPDDRPVWTGSCPCQPFSVSGSRKGEADARHLWPDWSRLIGACKPSIVFGEQVASKDGRRWLSRVRSQMEGLGYGIGCADLCAAGVAAPHIQQRLWFMAHAGYHERAARTERGEHQPQPSIGERAGSNCKDRDLAIPDSARLEIGIGERRVQRETLEPYSRETAECRGDSGGMANPDGRDTGTERLQRSGEHGQRTPVGSSFWSASDRLLCTDGKFRRVEPGSFPVAHGLSNRVGRLRAYGNAIVAQVAAEFIKAADECLSPS
jgi:DNA (cytosine-5)-methyltransferase 1